MRRLESGRRKASVWNEEKNKVKAKCFYVRRKVKISKTS